MRYICHRSWLGGWLLPQHKSYFALHLPHGWWLFGLDQALHGDIDIFQYKYFTDIIRDQVRVYISPWVIDIYSISPVLIWIFKYRASYDAVYLESI